MQTYAILRRGTWETPEEADKVAGRSAEVGEEMADQVSWIRSYIIKDDNGRLGTVCIYEAKDPDALRTHAKRAGMPADEIWPVMDTVVIRDDPGKQH